MLKKILAMLLIASTIMAASCSKEVKKSSDDTEKTVFEEEEDDDGLLDLTIDEVDEILTKAAPQQIRRLDDGDNCIGRTFERGDGTKYDVKDSNTDFSYYLFEPNTNFKANKDLKVGDSFKDINGRGTYTISAVNGQYVLCIIETNDYEVNTSAPFSTPGAKDVYDAFVSIR
ncbi:MAG: hypothetical protein J6U54_19240 [Clostridiales bacterium]|nr:hypothetical protein [Clostridiales bacterium]